MIGISGQGLTGLMVAWLWLTAAPATQPAEPVSGPHFSILTYNVNWGQPGPERTARAMTDARADILCLQETNAGWEQYLRPRLAGRYPHMLFRHSRAAGGLAVFSRYPIREVQYIQPTVGWFPAWLLQAETPLGAVRILVVHLRPPFDDQGRPGLGALLAVGPLHHREIQSLYPDKADAAPLVILGDFNEGDEGLALQWLAKKDLRDALSQFDLATITWRWQVGRILLQNRYDHILASPALHCLGAKVVQQGGSDHFPVLATFAPAATQPTTQTAQR